MWKTKVLYSFSIVFLLLSFLASFSFFVVSTVKAQEPQNTFGNPSLPDWKNISVVVAGDGKSFTLDNADNLTFTFEYGANKYDSISQNGVQIVKDELWMLQVYEGSWKDIGSSVNVFYEQVTSYNVRIIQSYTSKNGDYNVSWDFYGGFRPKISLSANIMVAGNYRIDWRTYVYKDYALNMTNYVKFWNGVEEAVVFDYSDVYEAFGNITLVEGVEGWVRGKRFDLVFNGGSLPIGLFGLDPSFGYETIGGSSWSIWPGAALGYIAGSVFTITEAGTADSITVALKIGAKTEQKTTKCAIYKHSDLSLVGQTEERTITISSTTFDWYTFNFTGTKPSLTTTTNYVLVVWGVRNPYASNMYLAYNAGDTNQSHYQDLAYAANFPDPYVPAHGTVKCSIFCNYTTTSGTSLTFNGVIPITFSLSNQRTWTFNRYSQITMTYTLSDWHTFAQNIAGSITTTFNVLLEKTVSFIKNPSITETFSIQGLKTVNFLRESLFTLTTTIDSLMSYSRSLNLFGLVPITFNVQNLKSIDFLRESVLTFTTAIDGMMTHAAIVNLFGTVPVTFNIQGLKSVSFLKESIVTLTTMINGLMTSTRTLNFFGIVPMTFNIQNAKAISFLRESVLTLTTAIDGLMSYTSGTFLNLFGIIPITFQTDSTRNYLFTQSGLINLNIFLDMLATGLPSLPIIPSIPTGKGGNAPTPTTFGLPQYYKAAVGVILIGAVIIVALEANKKARKKKTMTKARRGTQKGGTEKGGRKPRLTPDSYKGRRPLAHGKKGKWKFPRSKGEDYTK